VSDDKPNKPLKRLEVCPKCGGYMRSLSAFQGEPRSHGWHHEASHRSFGGVELKKFVCEKCHHTATFQIDDLTEIGEDD
jgi:ribosomal protein S27AE